MTPAAAASRTLAWAFGEPEVEAVFKLAPEDFRVIEELGFALTGSGEHACLRIRKTGVTTQDVVRLLARRAGIREFDVGYGGLKDKQGVCEQWFSLYQPVPAPLLLDDFAERGIEVLESCRNSRKLRRGSHKVNRFRIRLRNPQWRNGCAAGATALQALEGRLALVASRGVPNYFGEQRFGRDMGNVAQARQLFAGELRMAKGYKRGLLLSSARSQVFNEVLSERVRQQVWDAWLEGDVWNLNGSDSFFEAPQWTDELRARLQAFDIHPTGPLWGTGILCSSADTKALELATGAQWQDLCEGLEAAGLSQARRALRLVVQDLRWQAMDSGDLDIEFALPPGTYATTVLREVCILKEAVKE